MLICPLDSGHRIPENNINKHLTKCSLLKNGYNNNDVFLPPPADPGPHVILIGKD